MIDMCQAIQEIRMEAQKEGEQRGEQRGEQKGELKKARESAKKLYAMGFDIKKIAQVVDYPIETVKEWIELE